MQASTVASTAAEYQSALESAKKNPNFNSAYVEGSPLVKPNVYDGLMYDSNQFQLYDNTLYIAGVVVCTTLLLTGITLVSFKK